MKNVLRRCFLLFEVLIAMSLVMLLLSTLMGFYIEINRVNAVMEREQEVSFKKLLLSTRLASILPQALAAPKAAAIKKVTDPGGDFFFYSSLANDPFTKGGTQTLTLSFDNGINLDPAFSYHVLGRLYVNAKDQFCLAMWPSPARWDDASIPPIKHEVLFENVEDLRFEFYVPPARERKMILSNNKSKGPIKEDVLLVLSASGEWRDNWLQDYKELPSLVRVILKLKNIEIPLTFVYPLPQSRYIIVYE
jgi:hypothetical protein